MCGILGVVGKIEEQVFKKQLDTLAHRGPDGWGVWSDEKITLGHRRLSIIDLSDRGKQPMEVLDRYVIILNGEIYNYKEIKKELEAKGIKFYSASDTEVLIYSYVVWGEDCVNRFNGMWAFAIWDRREQTLFLSRDRMGKKPLFYIQQPDLFAFASEMKALYSLLPSIEINTDLVEKARQNVFCYETTEECLIKNISRFPAASNGIFKNGQLSIKKYWQPLDNLVAVPKNYNEQVEQFRELFTDACRLRMRSDVPVGTALSGGLDSSATISTMAWVSKNIQADDYSKDWQHAFVASFPGSAIDETKYAKQVVDHIGINATYLTVDPLKDIGKLEYYTYLFEEIYLTSLIPFIQLYGEVKRHGTTVTLDGHGADELFGGYPFDIVSKIKDDYPNIFKMKTTLKTYFDAVREKCPPVALWKHAFYHFIKHRSLIKDESKTAIESGFLNHQLYQSTFESVLPTLLRNYDRYSMINGVEIRMPFLDHRIVSFALSLPPSSKVRRGFTKAIVRDAMQDRMPHSIAYRKDKIGFNTPFADWLRGPLRTWINDIISSRDFEQCPFIDPEKVKAKIKTVQDAPQAQYALGERAWISIMTYFWEKSLQYAKPDGANSPVRI